MKKNLYNKSRPKFREGRKKSIYIAFFLGVIILGSAIILGRSPLYIAFVPVLIFMITLFWRKLDRPWISIASMAASTPIAITRFGFNGNLLFALCSVLFNGRCLSRLPKWIYIPSCLIMLGLMSSSVTWMSHGLISGMMSELVTVFNMFLGPFLLLPAIYLRMKDSQNHFANMQGLLFFLIIPSTALLISAKLFGSVSNSWVASQHASSGSAGYLMYKLGNAHINFLRTEVGFILAALICASAAIAVTQVKGFYRLLAGGCLIINVFLLLSTGSIGSTVSCFLGLSAIFYTQIKKVNITKVFVPVLILCVTLILTYVFVPQSTKTYLEGRFEHRVTNANSDRLILWGYGFDSLLEHPEGVGFTFQSSNGAFIHNDYIVYAVSYGIFGGLGYLILIVGLLLSFIKMRKKVSRDPSALAVYLAGIGVLVALSINGITDHSNESRWYFNAMWSIIWYCYFCSYPAVKRRSTTVANKQE